MRDYSRPLLTSFARLVRLACALLASGCAGIASAEVELPHELKADPKAFDAAKYPLGSATPWQPSVNVIEISPNVTAFYDGRDAGTDPDWINAPGTWTSFDAGLGTAAYAVHDGGEALVLDSLWTRSQGEFIRNHLATKHGVKRFTLALSHWHLDHIGGNGAFADSTIVSSNRTAEVLAGYAAHIRDGSLWGPPAMTDLAVPNTTFNDKLDITVGAIKVELSHYLVHSDDHIFLYLPEQKLGLVGDMTEDTVPVVSHPEQTPKHLQELERLKTVDMTALYPDHGNPEVIANGGYDLRAIDAAMEYQRNLVMRSHDEDFMEQKLESFIPEALKAGVVSVHEYYRVAHTFSRNNVFEYWHERPLPTLD